MAESRSLLVNKFTIKFLFVMFLEYKTRKHWLYYFVIMIQKMDFKVSRFFPFISVFDHIFTPSSS